MDATGLTVVASATLTGQTYVLGGKGRFDVIVTSVEDRTDADGPVYAHYALEGLQYRVRYTRPICDVLA